MCRHGPTCPCGTCWFKHEQEDKDTHVQHGEGKVQGVACVVQAGSPAKNQQQDLQPMLKTISDINDKLEKKFVDLSNCLDRRFVDF